MILRTLIPLTALYQWDNNILNDMYVAGDFDIKESFLLRFGEMTPIYQKPELLKLAVANVAKSLKWSIDRLYNVTLLEYNPIENYDRIEKCSDITDDTTDNTQNIGSQTITSENQIGATTTTPATTTETKVSAFNESEYQPSEQTKNTGNVTESHDKDTGTTTTTKAPDVQHMTYKRKYDHDLRVHGNIGVTTSQKMASDEVSLVTITNYIDLVCQMYAERLLINVW